MYACKNRKLINVSNWILQFISISFLCAKIRCLFASVNSLCPPRAFFFRSHSKPAGTSDLQIGSCLLYIDEISDLLQRIIHNIATLFPTPGVTKVIFFSLALYLNKRQTKLLIQHSTHSYTYIPPPDLL